jgi:hypothetical protein
MSIIGAITGGSARGNTVNFAFSFLDSAGAVVEVDSATVTLVYPGLTTYQKETLTLVEDEDDDMWKVTWNSDLTRPAWVEFHAHAISGSTELTEDGRFKVSGNRASMQHDKLAQGNNDYDESVI